MEKHHSVEATNRAPHLKEVQTGSRLYSSTVRGDSQLHGKAFQYKSIPYNSEGVEPNQQYSLLSFGGEKKILLKGTRSKDNLIWLTRSAVGEAVDGISAEALQNTILAEGFNDVVVRPMGGNKYLLMLSLEDTLKNYAQFLMVWFRSVKKTWVSCYGVPLHLWSSENFKMIAQIWGKFLSLDTSTSNLLSFERVRMCILTYSMSSIAEEIIIKEGQGSHIVSILKDGYLGTPLIYSTKVNAMKGNVVVTHSIDKVVSD
ncbi:hypothetical protein Cgig2_010411 [Carnegiea gigantea]|uniref:DUF4283 domain-containing protein n=1 Tax=Carnegiea gigantea TaxID=171969 RepID=A0A9Q1Q4V9_9CARY|nr:hypothetical protein Cgig2_010411 [Carnegiea gigantea]